MLPDPIAALAAELAAVPGAVAVALGGSRATGTHRPDSDWDLGLYYRGTLEPSDVRRLGHDGHVSALGEWGPIVNGGAWLTVDRTPVDVLFRDLDVIERWCAEAEHGRFEILAQNGHLAGALLFAGQPGDGIARTGMLANAVLCTAHARLAARREWVLNEKRLAARAGLEPLTTRPG